MTIHHSTAPDSQAESERSLEAGFGGFWKNSVQSCLARARYRYGARLLAAARWNRAIPARIVRGIPETTISDHKLIRT